MNTDLAIAHIAERQLGLITHAQSVRAGLSHRQIRIRVEHGVWDRVRAGVFLIRGAPRSWPQTVLSAVLAAGDAAYASHRTAARLWELPIERIDRVEVTIPIERRVRIPGVVAHRSGTLHELDVAMVAAVPVTSPARTLGDLSSALTVEELGKALDDGLRRRILSLTSMHAVSSRFRGISPGRSPKKMDEVLAIRIPGYDPGDSDLETEVWNAIRKAGLPMPVRQHPVRVAGRVFKIDLSYPDQMIAIEADGFGPHGTRTAFDDDRVRQNALVLVGWRFLRFTSQSTERDIADSVRTALFGHSVTPHVTH